MKKADTSLPLQRLCAVFGVSLSSYYDHKKMLVRQSKDENISLRIDALHQEHLHCFGKRRMQKALEKEGLNIGIFKVARLMKDAGIVAKTPKKPHYYPAGNDKPTIPNLLKRKFNPETLNTHWVGDITYIRNH